MSLADTPRGNRLHIGLFGPCNSGKSSLLNALTGQQAAIVSPTPGTTTDPVYKAMELHGVGPVVFIDTAGYDDEGELGNLRTGKTREAMKAADIALLLFPADREPTEEELAPAKELKSLAGALISLVSRFDLNPAEGQKIITCLSEHGFTALPVSSVTGEGLENLREEIIRVLPEDYEIETLTGDLCEAEDTVLLVMPQDLQAPKGRLILPQVQTMRELLDKKCLVLGCALDGLSLMLKAIKEPPKLIITDSQCFKEVYSLKPPESKLTSFSLLFARAKGDIKLFLAGAEKLLSLPPTARILIAEACTHKPLREDIGRVKLPRLLKKRLGETVTVTVVSGRDFPADLTPYDLIIHCGACMFNRRYVLNRTVAANKQKIPMTNYGLAIAALTGILDKVSLPGD